MNTVKSTIDKYWPPFKKVLFYTPATQDTAILYLSTLSGAAIGFIASLIVARTLPPSEFGIITAYNSIILTAVGLTEFGLSTALIRYATPLLREDKNKANAFFRFVFYAEIATGLLVFAVGIPLVPVITRLVGSTLSSSVVRLAILASAIATTSAYIGASLNAHKLFKRHAVIIAFNSTLRLVITFSLLKSGNLELNTLLYSYFGLTILNAVVGFLWAPKDYLNKVPLKELKAAAKKVAHFSGWLTLSYILTSLSGRLDFFFLYRIKGPNEAGVYAAAIQLSIVFSLLIGAISTVMTPYISEKISLADKKRFLKKTLPLMLAVALILCATIPILPFVLDMLFGQKYLGAANPLRILIISFGINMLLLPISLMFIPLNKVYFGAIMNGITLLLSLILYPILISRYGSVGAALTVLVGALLALTLYPLVLVYFLRQEATKINV